MVALPSERTPASACFYVSRHQMTGLALSGTPTHGCSSELSGGKSRKWSGRLRRHTRGYGEVSVDGDLAFADDDMHKGENPNTVAAAYIDSFGKPEKTAMYNINATLGALVQQTPPDDGKLAAVGKPGIANPAGTYAFDIHTDQDGKNTAWLVNGVKLYTVDLKTGLATAGSGISGSKADVRAIALLPSM